MLRRDIAIVGDGDRDRIVLDVHGLDEQAMLTGAYDGVRCPFGVLFDHTRASLTNLTIRGLRESVAIIVEGGAPTIRAVAGNLDGAWQGPPSLRHFLYVTGDASGLIADLWERPYGRADKHPRAPASARPCWTPVGQ